MTDTQLRKQAYNRAYREANRERLNAYDRARASQPERQYSARKEYAKAWYQKNHEIRAVKMRAWYLQLKADPVRYAAFLKNASDYCKRRPDIRRKRDRNWRRAHPDKVRVYKRQAKAIKKHALGRCLPFQWEARLAYYGGLCAYCGIALIPENTHTDHVIALKIGGTNWPSNLVPACTSCNCKKQKWRWIPHNFSLI